MDINILIRAAAYVILAGALLAAAVALDNRPYPMPPASSGDPSRESGALDSELARCRALEAAAADDAACKTAWQANRERFLGLRKLPQDRVTNAGPAIAGQQPTWLPGEEQAGRALQQPALDSAPLAPNNKAGRSP